MEVAQLPPEKLNRLKAMSDQVRIGGRGTARRKKKVVNKSAAADDKRLQASLKKMNLNMIPGIEEVNMYKTDGTMINFKNPKVQMSPQANVFAVSGQSETKNLSDIVPGVLSQLEEVTKKAEKMKANKKNDDIPELTEDFDAKCKNE